MNKPLLLQKIITAALFATMLISILSLSSCKDDEEDLGNYFSINGKNFAIGSAFTFYLVQVEHGIFMKELYLISDSLQFIEKNGQIDSITGKGNYLVIRVVTNDTIGITPGMYTFNSQQNDFLTSTFGWDSQLVLNFDSNDPYSSKEYLINGGTITIKKGSDVYDVTLSLDCESGIKIAGYFRGKMKEYNYKK
jgi:hypothetical protein